MLLDVYSEHYEACPSFLWRPAWFRRTPKMKLLQDWWALLFATNRRGSQCRNNVARSSNRVFCFMKCLEFYLYHNVTLNLPRYHVSLETLNKTNSMIGIFIHPNVFLPVTLNFFVKGAHSNMHKTHEEGGGQRIGVAAKNHWAESERAQHHFGASNGSIRLCIPAFHLPGTSVKIFQVMVRRIRMSSNYLSQHARYLEFQPFL